MYIHYGHKSFDRREFKPIKNRFYFPKPDGGLWASPVDTTRGWKDWCDAENYSECDENKSFRFALDANANVCHIDACSDAMGLPQMEQDNSALFSRANQSYPDFEQMLASGIDAILFNMTSDYGLYWVLYGWDCDSLLVLNPDVVISVG